MLVIRDILQGRRRFDEIQENLGIATNILTTRLKRLTEAGLLLRKRYQEKPPRYEYELTEKGRALSPILLGLVQWGNRFLAGSEGPPTSIIHEPCGHQAKLAVVCPHCESVKPHEVRIVQMPRGRKIHSRK